MNLLTLAQTRERESEGGRERKENYIDEIDIPTDCALDDKASGHRGLLNHFSQC